MLSISQAATITGLSIKSIRHYEQIGLISAPPRSENEYRYYPDALLKQLHFIKSTKDAGFTLKESRALLELAESDERCNAEVEKITLKKIAEIEKRIEQQQNILTLLKSVTERCHSSSETDCPLIKAFEK